MLLSSGMRRGELMGLRWEDIDLELGKVRVERAIEKTKAHGLRLKAPSSTDKPADMKIRSGSKNPRRCNAQTSQA
jgi:integrase